MKKVCIKLAKILGLMAAVLFVGIFVWANRTPLSLGEKQEPVDFAAYDVANLGSDQKASKICQYIKKMDGIGGTNNVPALKAIIVTYKPLEIAEQEIITRINHQFHYQLKRKVGDPNAKRCPMSGSRSFMSQIRKALNVRG